VPYQRQLQRISCYHCHRHIYTALCRDGRESRPWASDYLHAGTGRDGIPGGRAPTEISPYSGIALRLSHAALERVAKAMAPHHFQERDLLAAINGFRVFSLETRPEAILLNQIRHLIALVDPLLGRDRKLKSWADLDDQLCRRLVALLLPALI